ncbi:MAG: hypothetical protein LBK63_02800 [Treponema sp.]|jgi:hypothetical protein|nr:hypothetical protein [Treponema sp.]
MTILRKKAIYFLLVSAVLSLAGGCSGRIEGKLRRDGQAELSLEIALEPRMGAMLRSLSSLGSPSRRPPAGAPAEGAVPVINGPVIARSLAAAPGILSADLANTSPTGIAGTISVSRVDQFLALNGVPERKRFVALENNSETGYSRLVIALDRETAPLLLAMISVDIRDYLSALFAPAATGDALSKAEYLGLVEDIYGKALADEIAAARVSVTIGFPGAISSAKGGTFSGSSARFDIALADILVLENPLAYEVVWK